MKVLLAIVIAVVLAGGWKLMAQRAERQAILAEAAATEAASADVVLFATSWCGYCEATRRFLKGRGISYVEFDIEKSKEGERRYHALGGDGGIPLLQVKGKVVRGYDEAGILAALQ